MTMTPELFHDIVHWDAEEHNLPCSICKDKPSAFISLTEEEFAARPQMTAEEREQSIRDAIQDKISVLPWTGKNLNQYPPVPRKKDKP